MLSDKSALYVGEDETEAGGEAAATAGGGGGKKEHRMSVKHKDAIFQGVLLKRGNNLLKDWRERWFVMNTHSLKYFKNKDDTTPLASIPLSNCTAKAHDGFKEKSFCFEVSVPGRSYYMAAGNDIERDLWIKNIIRTSINAPKETSLLQSFDKFEAKHAGDKENKVGEKPEGEECKPEKENGSTTVQDETKEKENESDKESLQPKKIELKGMEQGRKLSIDRCYSKEGYLNKLGNNVRNDWRIRWFLLNTNTGTLDYYSSPGDIAPKGSIKLLLCSVSAVANRHFPHCFSIITPNRSYCVAAENATEMNDWMKAISEAHVAILNKYEKELDGKIKKEVIVAGHLYKQGKNVLGDWRKRWCILRTDYMHYYKSESDTSHEKEMGKIPMLVASVKQSDQRRFAFDVTTPNRVYRFQAENREEMLDWVNRIREVSESLLNALPVERDYLDSSGSCVATNDRSGQENVKSQEIKPVDALNEALSLPENQFCIDCSRPGPRWAVANIGIFCCLECSGIHRSLGVHISRVRSVDLDTWKPSAIERMYEIGNLRANEIWESNVPPEWANRKPKPEDPWAKKQEWIQAKYEFKLFCKPSDEAPEPSAPPSFPSSDSSSSLPEPPPLPPLPTLPPSLSNHSPLSFSLPVTSTLSSASSAISASNPSPQRSASFSFSGVNSANHTNLLVTSASSLFSLTSGPSMRLYKEGWLTKQGNSVKSWKKRWFVLKEDCLYYYRVRGDSLPAGMVNLSFSAVRRTPAHRKPNSFEIITRTRIYSIHADNVETLNEWITMISASINKYYNAAIQKEENGGGI